MRKLTHKEYIDKCNEVHNSKYDYSLVEYKDTRSKITIICKEHGTFIQNAKNHKDGQGCPRCSAPNSNLTKEEFILKCNDDKYDYSLLEPFIKIKGLIRIIEIETGLIYQQYACHRLNAITPTRIERDSLMKKLSTIHNNKYDYVIDNEVLGATSKIKIINKETNDVFYYGADRHLLGMSPNKVTLNLFLLKSNKLHNNKYDYSLVKNINGNTDKVDIICREHGVFNQRISNHMNLGDGCPKCVGIGRWNTDYMIDEFRKIHLDTFDYSLSIFENIDKKVKIICKEHGIFEQNIHKHLKGQGCRYCSSYSKGEDFVKIHLEEMKVKYI